MKSPLSRLVLGLTLLSPLSAAAAKTATVAFVTNNEGAHLTQYLPALAASPTTTSVLMADSSGQVVAMARKTLGAKLTAVYSSEKDLLAHAKPDLVVITLEPRLATPAIDMALDAGCNVLAEKPAVLSVADITRLAAKANRKKLMLMLALANRINPDIIYARQLIRENKIGKIYGIEVQLIADHTRLTKPAYHHSWFAQKARAGGGHLIWLGIHWIDLATYLTGANVTDVTGFTANVGGEKLDVEDSAVLSLKFDQGFLGTVTSGYYVDKGYHSHIKIWGATGWIELNPYGGDTPFRYYTTTEAHPEVHTYEVPDLPKGYAPFVEDCVRASLGLRAAPVSPDDCVRVIRTIYAAYKAAATGETQHLPAVE